MQLNYTLKKRDIFFGRICLMFQNKILLSFSILAICLFAFALSTGDEVRKQSMGFRIFFAVFSLGFSAAFYLGVVLVLNLITVLAGKHVGLVGSHTLEIKDEGLEESTTVNRSLHRWNPELKVKEFGNYVLIYPTDDRFFQIPKRPGGHEGDLAGFVAELKTKIGR